MEYQNITYSHEHMVIDLRKKGSDDCYLNVYEDAMDEIIQLRDKGVSRIIDCSNIGIGRNIEVIKKIEQISGIEILWSTGYYKDPFFPFDSRKTSMETLIHAMLEDIKNGASFLAEIGTSNNGITVSEQMVLEAVCIVHKQTRCPIITHTTLGTCAEDQVAFLKNQKVDLKNVIISHTDLKDDPQMLLRLLKQGVNLAFDTIGKTKYLSDEKRAQFIALCCKEGYASQLFMSMDLTRKSHLKRNGGLGYTYLLDTFLPLLEQHGVLKNDIETILCRNMNQLLERSGRK